MKIWSNKWFLLFFLTLTWGSSFIMIKQSLLAYTPFQVGSLRLTMAGLVLMPFGIRNLKYIPKKLLFWVVLAGCFGNFIPMFLFPYAQQEISSALAGILDSLVPIFVLLFGFLFFKVTTGKTQILGALIGFTGAVILIGLPGSEQSVNYFYAGLIILATVFYAINGLIIDNYLSKIPSFKLSSVLFTIWLIPSVITLFFSGFFSEFTGSEVQMKGLGFVSILAFVGTATAIILYYKLIQETSAFFASIVTFLMPIVAIMWGVLDGEPITLIHLAGALLILSGIYLIQKKSDEKEVTEN